VLNRIKLYLLSSKVYFAEAILFYLFLLLIIITQIANPTAKIIIIISFTVVTFIFLLALGAKRLNELGNIKNVISSIRRNKFQTSEEIMLSENLLGLQFEIREMFEKGKNDIEYLKKLEKMRKEFLANVSHELRTPIFTIQGYIETLLHGAIDDKKVNKSFLEKANTHTISLSNLLNDLIDISMIESGEMRLSFRYFDIVDYLKKLIEEIRPTIADKDISLDLVTKLDRLNVYGDKDKLRQVFINLIQNAIKYTEKGTVAIIVEREEKDCNIIVRDTGIGIPEDALGRIFERFYRVDKARSRSVGGTGLGLAIVKHIIEAHDSKIVVKSKLNEGSEFSFKLKI
jgi:two-component system phosphate regulon sensor histidine kinase PhoR